MAMKLRAEWDGYNWVGELKGGGLTQAKRLDLLRQRAVEVVKLMSGKLVTPEEIELELVIDVPDLDVNEAAREIARLSRALEDTQHQLAQRRKTAVQRLHDRGLTLRDIGLIIGLSHQRVDQLLK